MVLYAPTHRTNIDNHSMLDINETKNTNQIIESLEKKFNRKVSFLLRTHHLTTIKNDNKDLIDCSKYDDMQHLLLISDFLISDYSSCMWDFAFQRKPCFLYAPDLDYYIRDRDFFMDIKKWPFPFSDNLEKLKLNITDFKYKTYQENIDNYFDLTGSYHKGDATLKVIDYIQKRRKR